jgi:hypothetical protein
MRHRCLVALLAPLWLIVPAHGEDAFARTVQPFLKTYCFGCHQAEKQKGGVRFDQLKDLNPADRNLWTMVHGVVASGEMPPKERKQPTEAEKRMLLELLADWQKANRPESTRRLNRREISFALQDVTGLKIDHTLGLPEDGKVDGFDTGAEGLQDTADSVAKMMEVTRRAVESIRFLEPASSKIFSGDFSKAKEPRRAIDHWKDAGGRVKPNGLNLNGKGVLIEPKWLGDRDAFSFSLPVNEERTGVVRLKFTVARYQGEFKNLPNPRLWVEIGGTHFDYREITASPEQPLELVYDVQIDDLIIETRGEFKGLSFSLHNKIEMPYAVDGFENENKSKEELPGGPTIFRPVFDRKLPPEKQPVPFILLSKIEVEMNHVSPWLPLQVEDNDASAKRLLQIWTDRAWRRPTTESERQRFFELYRDQRAKGKSFDGAIRPAMQAVLMSSPFRYLAAPTGEHSQYALASRLSFFLTSAPPDAELLKCASEKKLSNPKRVDEQVDRLLNDPRSERFVRSFTTQWLEMGQPITLTMDHIQRQDFRFGRYLKDSMQEETIQYLRQLLKENRPAHELIHSDWTMLNDSLANYYGYSGIGSGEFRKVSLKKDDPRGGGILSHAGIQSMLCWMGDNWVIYRGAWTLRAILDDPPPPPPLEVPELNPSDGANRGKTFKQLLKQHQADERCSVCHQSMDPLGFAFQNFDLSGRWRNLEFDAYKREELDGKIAWNGVGKSRPVDTVGQLPRGEKFNTFAEAKEQIVKHYRDDLVRGLLKKLLLYSTGRKPDISAMNEIARIQKELKPEDFRLRDLVKAIVRSERFQPVER